jgi:hypothetical protein
MAELRANYDWTKDDIASCIEECDGHVDDYEDTFDEQDFDYLFDQVDFHWLRSEVDYYNYNDKRYIEAHNLLTSQHGW